jgi:hypothetical protein
MRNAVSRAVEGRAALVVGVVALVAALGGSAIALPGSNKVDSGDIKNSQVGVQDLKIATVRVQGDGDIVQTRNVQGTDAPVPNVVCLNLRFKAKTGSATRAVDAGADFTIAQIGVPPVPAQLGCDAPFRDAVFQVPGQPDVDGTYAHFIG